MPELNARLSIGIVCLAFAASALGTPANKLALARHLGKFLPAKLNSCATCHVAADPRGAESLKDFPHNTFGRRLRALGDEMTIGERLDKIAAEDSDGDGVPNIDELLAGSGPGNARQSPKVSAALRARYGEFRKRYLWRSFAKVKRPTVPKASKNGLIIRNPIDAFVAAAQQKRGLKPRPEAARDLWLRRVYLDLIGLAPTPAQREAFLKDPAPRAHERAVDALLANPAYGERWGRHWMDVWRYSDWAGYKQSLRESQRHIWHWRDWIVEALNEDKKYDRMILEMLAADEAMPEDSKALRATGYLARQFFSNRDQWMDDVVKHTSQAFMGVTIGCVRCHDHKYDEFPQEDYYAMRAIFAPYNVRTDRVPGVLDVAKNGLPRAFDASLEAKVFLFKRGDERHPIKDRVIEPGVPATLGGQLKIRPVNLPPLAWQPDRREFVKKDLLAAAQKKVSNAKTDAARKVAQLNLDALRAELKTEPLKKDSTEWKAAAKAALKLQREAKLAEAQLELEPAAQAQAKAKAIFALAKEGKNKAALTKAKAAQTKADKALAAAKKTLIAATKAAKETLTTKFAARQQAKHPSQSTGRRLAFARWLGSPGNPLTARVAMNHIWLRHFGQPIVPTVYDFGAGGREPTHPELLDWLAAEFMARGWSMKAMHRLICTSSAYRMASTDDPAQSSRDPDNLFLWRMPARRLEGEAVRDNLLWIAGTLDAQRGGPDIAHTSAQTVRRRSIYFRHAHEKLVPFVQIFDGPKVSECYQRAVSVQPHQALALANSRLTYDQSVALEKNLGATVGTNAGRFIEAAFIRILCRAPTPKESAACAEFLQRRQANPQRARVHLVKVLFNHNDFVTVR